MHDWPGVEQTPPSTQSALVQQALFAMHAMSEPRHTLWPEGHWHIPPGMGQTSPVMVHSPLLQQVPVGMHVPEAAQGT